MPAGKYIRCFAKLEVALRRTLAKVISGCIQIYLFPEIIFKEQDEMSASLQLKCSQRKTHVNTGVCLNPKQ